jgi:hypothetical protein
MKPHIAMWTTLLLFVLGGATAVQAQQHGRVDYYQNWLHEIWRSDTATGMSSISSFPQYFPSPYRPDLAQRLSYEPARYMIPAYLIASRVKAIDDLRGDSIRLRVAQHVARLLNPLYYRDVGLNIENEENGLRDGYMGWYNAHYGTEYVIPKVIDNQSWYHVRIRVNDTTIAPGNAAIRCRVWIDNASGQPDYDDV